jgi:site-specific DNA-methyltransferase (adenine-specific)
LFNPLKVKADKAKLPHTLITGPDGEKYQTYELTAPGATKQGESGKPWRGFDPNRYARHWGNSHEQMDEWDAAGLIHWPKDGGFPRRRDAEPFDPDSRTVVVGDVWTDIDRLNQTAKERLGYPTQKPLALLERIISASSKEEDVVLDPFCGCGTAVHAAEKLKRKWNGIDITHLAIGLIERRLRDAFPGIEFKVEGTPKDFAAAEDLAKRDKYQFQWWAVTLINAVPHAGKKKGADSGIDGYYYCKPDGKKTEAGIISVKAGESLHVDMVRDLRGVIEREKAPFAVLITLREPTQPMIAEAAAAGFFDTPFGRFPRIQIATVPELMDGKLPKLPPQEIGGGYKRAAREEAEQARLV